MTLTGRMALLRASMACFVRLALGLRALNVLFSLSSLYAWNLRSQMSVLLLLRPSALRAAGRSDTYTLVATRTAKSGSHSITSEVSTRLYYSCKGKRYDSTGTPKPDASCGRLTATTDCPSAS